MTIISHSLTGAFLCAAPARHSTPGVKAALAIGGLAVGMAPDLLTYLYHVWYTPTDRWFFYQAFHQNSLWWSWIVPPYFIHVILDIISHDENGWLWYTYLMEVVSWPLNILGLYWVFKKR